MRIVTISREFGSGGRELGKRLADALGFDYYDREIITAIAEKQQLDENYVEKALDQHAWQMIPLTFHHSFTGANMLQTAQTKLLLEERHILEGIARLGKDCVIVGRNADILLRDEHPLNLFVCADMDAKIRRCQERADSSENLSYKDIERNARRIDQARAKTRDMISGTRWGARENYHLIINTTEWNIKELTPVIADFVTRYFEKNN